MSRARKVAGQAVTMGSRLLDALAVRASLRPRRWYAGMVFSVFALASLAPAQPAAAATDPCSGGWASVFCTIGAGTLLPGIGPGLLGLGQAANSTIDALNPSNIIGEWTQGCAKAVVFVLTFIEEMAEKIGTPAFNQDWWLAQYGVTFGLSLVVLAFMLIIVTAKIGAGNGSSVSGVELLRQSGPRMIFVVPLITMAPALMYLVQEVASELMRTFATSATQQASGAVGSFIKMISDAAGKGWGPLGGTFFTLLLLVIIVFLGFVLLIEIAVANWGMMLIGLLVPLALVAWVYPPWSRMLRRICGILLGLMFMPTVVFFFFWTVWSAMNALFSDGSNNSPVTIAVFMVVSLFMIDAFPLVGIWLMGIVSPGAEGLPGDVRGAVPSPSPGDVYDSTFSKGFSKLKDMRGSGGDGEDGDDGDDDSADVEPAAGQDKDAGDGETGGGGDGGSGGGGEAPDEGGPGGMPTPGGSGGSPTDGDGGSGGGGKGGGAGEAGGAGEGVSLGDAAAVAAV